MVCGTVRLTSRHPLGSGASWLSGTAAGVPRANGVAGHTDTGLIAPICKCLQLDCSQEQIVKLAFVCA